MKMNKIFLPTALVAVSLAAGCGGQQTPVAQVAVEPRQVSLPFAEVRPLRLTWTPSAALEGETPTVFIHLLDGDRKVVRTFDHPFPQRWREGTPVSYEVDLYQSAMAPPLPAGKYPLTLGLYDKEGKRWALDGLGEPKAGRNEYDAALEGEAPTVFVHLLDGDRKVVRTFDHPFPQRWREGTPVSYEVDLYQSAMAPPLPAGKYQLTLGLYDKEGKRWALDGLGEPKAGRNEYDAATVEVPAGSSKPRFAFSSSWLPVEPGGDRQVLARRSMASRAAIRVIDQPGPGTVWMMIRIPPADLPDTRLVLDPGATAPSVRVVGNCGGGSGDDGEDEENDADGGTETSLSGPGIHEVELSVDAPPANGFCRVLLSSNFLLEPTVAVGRKSSISLESIAWVSGGGGARRTAGTGVKDAASPTSPE